MLTKAEIQRLRSLREKRHREELGLFLIEGEKGVADLVAGGFPLEEIYATPDWKGPKTCDVSRPRWSGSATCRPPRPSWRSAAFQGFPSLRTVWIAVCRWHSMACRIRAMYSTLLRVADWFALDRVVLSPDCADPFSPKVIHASMGSFSRVTLHTADLPAALAAARAPVFGCDLGGEDVHRLPPVQDAVIVIGSEGRGLSDGVRALVTTRITIPRHGRAESLNAAIAAAIICDNLRRPPTPG